MRHHVMLCGIGIAALVTTTVIGGCNRPLLHKLIDKFGSKEHEKPTVYHEYEGYSPGAKRSTVVEDFNRYYYYIAPVNDGTVEPEPDIYFRQDYDEIEMPQQTTFDEDQYWREHPLIVEDNEP